MSSKGNLANREYAKECIKMAKDHKNAIGVISQSRLDDTQPDLIHMTPGVKFEQKSDNLGKQYNTPENAAGRGADIIIVGRGITEAENCVQKAEEYRNSGWRALMSRTMSQD